MRRSLAPYNHNFKRRGGERIELIRDLLTIDNTFSWLKGGTVAFSASYGMQVSTDGAYSQLNLPINESFDGNLSFKFSFASYGRGSGNDQCYFYFGNYTNYTYYMVAYLRQYSTSDQYFAWAIKNAAHYVYNDAAVFYNCTKYNWYDTYGSWYTARFELINGKYIRIKVWTYGAVEPVAWDYAGSIYLGNACGFNPFCFGIYAIGTSGNGLCMYGLEIDKIV